MTGGHRARGWLDWQASYSQPGLYFCALYVGCLCLDFWAVQDDFGNLIRVER